MKIEFKELKTRDYIIDDLWFHLPFRHLVIKIRQGESDPIRFRSIRSDLRLETNDQSSIIVISMDRREREREKERERESGQPG